ncbi:hypothetical protein HanXRQr2_Chr08g0337781 [Helianthus annuus]|uniref:Uncharacterized protein n=1 Tax=Helianthus annuus TaxID=4232 RepID=A0A9K3IEX3_HELAN|nr:hypothetical protein HanXRQr2_Chr08g0337781 [Helianthus annuus]
MLIIFILRCWYISAFFFERAVGSSSALFLKSEVQKVEYFFMINEEVNAS